MAKSNMTKSTSLVTKNSQSSAPAWQLGFCQIPWPVMILILIMLACMGASAYIIIASDKQMVDSWKVNPAVLLAFFSSIWGSSLITLQGVGVTVTWWKSALHGTTLESLHYIWNHGSGLNPLSALRSSVAARKVVLLTWVILLVQVFNNSLLQRSSQIAIENVVVEDDMLLNMNPELPDGWLGLVVNGSAGEIIGGRNCISTLQQWFNNEQILSSNETGYQCDGTCEGKVRGTGLDYNCSSTMMALDMLAQKNAGSVLFGINTTMSTNSTGAPILVLTTLYPSAIDNSCIAALNVTTCSIEAAVIEYPIVIQNITITLDMEKLHNTTVVSKYISAGDLPTAATYQGVGPLEGLNDVFGGDLAVSTKLQVTSDGNTSLYIDGGLIGDLFFLPGASNYDASIFHKCGLKWSDPTEYILDSMHDFLFRTSLSASTNADIQVFSVQRTYLALIFQSNHGYLAAALAVMLAAVSAVLFQLWGWWELGRQVSLSPLELAKAFGAPVMQCAEENLAVDEILKLTGKTRVQYDGESFRETGDVVLGGAEEMRNDEEHKGSAIDLGEVELRN